jgi:hypothetical protein
VTPEELEVELAPGSHQSVALQLRTVRPVRFERLGPTLGHLTLRSSDPTGRIVEIERPVALLPERRFPIGRSAEPVELDGALDEWIELPFVVYAANPGGGALRAGKRPDEAARFAVRQDDAFLYVGIDVTDDSLVASAERMAREQDSVTVSLDARPDPQRSANESWRAASRSGALAAIISATVTLVEPRVDPRARLFGGAGSEGVRISAQRTARGYSAELAVPHALLDERQGSLWEAVRLNVGIDDFDEGKPGHATFTWRPSRFGPLAVEGSGTFVRR